MIVESMWGAQNVTSRTIGRRDDISLISLETDATVCGYFTQNMYRSATVVISENNIKDNPPKYIIVNAGNANACTGYEGELDIKK